MNRILQFTLILSIILFTSCREDIKDEYSKKEIIEYSQKFSNAMVGEDQNLIQDAIVYIDNLILSDDSNITSLYYNKSQLLYKLSQFDEAIAVMIRSPQEIDDYYVATLMLSIDKYSEIANYIIDDLILKNRYKLLENENEYENKVILAKYLIDLYILSDRDVKNLYKELEELKVFKKIELDNLIKEQLLDKEGILESTWPK